MMKEDMATELRAAETILQRGVKVKARAPLLLRMLFIRRITLTLRNPTAGTMMRVASYYLRTGLTAEKLDDLSAEEALAIMAVHGGSLRRAAATAILNGWISGWLLVRPIAWYLKWYFTEAGICTMVNLLITYGGLKDFTTTTRYIRGMKITSPTNLGQKTRKGS